MSVPRLPSRSGALVPLALVLLAACGGDKGSDPLVPSVLEKTAGDQVTGTVGAATTAPALRVTDSRGRPVPNVVVNFSASAGSLGATVDTTDAQGVATTGSWTLGTVAGPQTVTASSPTVAGTTATFTATANAGAPTRLVFASQVGNANDGTPFTPPAVDILDAFGNRTSSTAAVTLSLSTSGVGSLTGATTANAVDGRATFGQVTINYPGAQVALLATSGSLAPAFSSSIVLRVSQFNIELRYVNEPTPAQRSAFENAVERWRAVIIGELQDIGTSSPISNICGTGQTFSGTVDDLVIYVNLRAIDGPGQVLGSAGPCAVRPVAQGSVNPNVPAIGVMNFDTADLTTLENAGQLGQVILHEMGHVLGIGTMWTDFGLLIGATTDSSSFDGAQARAVWNTLGGAAGTRVPVENCVGITQSCGAGTRDGHWRELTFRTELMTGYLNGGVANPLSALTIRSLQDIGYTVDAGTAESYVLPTTANLGGIRGALVAETPGREIVEGRRTWDRIVLDGRGGWQKLPPRD